MNFNCTWEPKYYGVIANITLSDTGSTVNHTCSVLPEDGFHIMKISPWTLFERNDRSELFHSVNHTQPNPAIFLCILLLGSQISV